MVTTLLFVGGGFVIVVILTYAFLRKGGAPLVYRDQALANLPRFVRSLHQQSADGSVLVVAHQESNRFVQFRFRRPTSDQAWVEFGVPDAPWSRDVFDGVVVSLQKAGFKPTVVSTGNDGVQRFAIVQLTLPPEEQPQEAMRAAMVSLEAMQVPKEAMFSITTEGALDRAAIAKWRGSVQTE